MRKLTLLICLLAPAAVAIAQDKPAAVAPAQNNPFSAFNKEAYGYFEGCPAPLGRKNARGELQF